MKDGMTTAIPTSGCLLILKIGMFQERETSRHPYNMRHRKTKINYNN